VKRLNISSNQRFLVFEDGTPFFWLGDTIWELFHRGTLEEGEYYLENRRQKGFTVLQAVVLAEFDGLKVPNAYGELPLIDHDPLRPNEKYFHTIDQFIALAGKKDLFIGLLPTWGDKIELLGHGKGPIIFNPENAFQYGQWIGRRYRDVWNIIWINGGDRSGGGANQPIWDALGRGIKSVDSNHLMTFHPLGGGDGYSSSAWFHQSDWLDFNLAQSGHVRKGLPNYALVTHDYNLLPPKPCLDGEPRYEDHAVNWKPQENGWFDDYDARQAAYWALFAGAFGHTYGCHPVWQMFQPGREPISFARRPWREALDLPGAFQMAHVKKLLLSRSFLTRIPDQFLIVAMAPNLPEQVRATRDEAGSYAFIYLPVGGRVTIDLVRLAGTSLNANWYDPRNGTTARMGSIQRQGTYEFTAPSHGPGQDWVLTLDRQ
jgi:hypothetical protein